MGIHVVLWLLLFLSKEPVSFYCNSPTEANDFHLTLGVLTPYSCVILSWKP